MAMCTMEMATRASIPIMKAVPTFAPTHPGATASFGCTPSASVGSATSVTYVTVRPVSAERARSLTPGRGLGDVTGARKTATSRSDCPQTRACFLNKKDFSSSDADNDCQVRVVKLEGSA